MSFSPEIILLAFLREDVQPRFVSTVHFIQIDLQPFASLTRLHWCPYVLSKLVQQPLTHTHFKYEGNLIQYLILTIIIATTCVCDLMT